MGVAKTIIMSKIMSSRISVSDPGLQLLKIRPLHAVIHIVPEKPGPAFHSAFRLLLSDRRVKDIIGQAMFSAPDANVPNTKSMLN